MSLCWFYENEVAENVLIQGIGQIRLGFLKMTLMTTPNLLCMPERSTKWLEIFLSSFFHLLFSYYKHVIVEHPLM
jgi:hypothetical protein